MTLGVSEQRLNLLESNFGRSAGWWLEKSGARIAVLTDYQWADMFWDGYRFAALEGCDEDLAQPEFWENKFYEGEYGLRNRRFTDYVASEFVLPGGGKNAREGYILMRGLSVRGGSATTRERLALWIRSRRGRRDLEERKA